MCYTNNAVEMASLGRNVPNTTNNTPPVPDPVWFDYFLSALMDLKMEETSAPRATAPSAPQTTAGYLHGILNQAPVPEPTIDDAPAFPTPRSRRK